jgi:hypothetical protein
VRGGLYKLLVDPVEQIWQNAIIHEGSSSVEETFTKGLSQQEGVDLDETLTPVFRGFS